MSFEGPNNIELKRVDPAFYETLEKQELLRGLIVQVEEKVSRAKNAEGENGEALEALERDLKSLQAEFDSTAEILGRYDTAGL